MVDNITPIRKYAKVNHGTVLDLYKVGTEDLLAKIEKLDSRRACIVGAVVGILMTVSVVLVSLMIVALV